MVGKCIFGVQPTSSLNANYENSFSKALTPDLTWKKGLWPMHPSEQHASSLFFSRDISEGRENWQRNCYAVWLTPHHHLPGWNSDDTVLTGAFAPEETHSVFHSERRRAEGIKRPGVVKHGSLKEFGVVDWSSWAPCRGRHEEAKEWVSYALELVRSCLSLDQFWKLLLDSLLLQTLLRHVSVWSEVVCRSFRTHCGAGHIVHTPVHFVEWMRVLIYSYLMLVVGHWFMVVG